jgi:protein SMG7
MSTFNGRSKSQSCAHGFNQHSCIASLRRRYLNLLLVHPYSKESQDVETHLWMQTSHAFIASYKQRVQALDRAIQNQNKARQQGHDQRPNVSHAVEHRKLVQRFRQFLAEEEKFWTQLVVRLCRSFALTEAAPALIALGILSDKEEVNQPSTAEPIDGASNSAARNHFQFPPEDTSTSLVPKTAADKESRLSILTKAVICLGDIARYRELYNESGGRPKAGQEDSAPVRRARTRRGQPSADPLPPRPRDYHKAQQCYEQAKLLMPYDGNPFHQLAILSFYQKDSFVSLLYYYRALCVRQPYDTASENLGSVLTKALDYWYSRPRREKGIFMKDSPPRVKIECFKDRILVLHAVWRAGLKDTILCVASLTFLCVDLTVG